MAFFKKSKQKVNGKWYPRSITVGKPVSTTQVAKRISAQCTVTSADTHAVLISLGGVLADLMAEGRTVKLYGVGTFYYTANTAGNGVDTEDEVTASQINGVRIRFIPEMRANSSHQIVSRALVSDDISWEEWLGKAPSAGKDDGSGDGGGDIIDPMG